MIAAIVLAAAAAHMVGNGLVGLGIDITAEYFVPVALRTGIPAPHAFIGLQDVFHCY